MPKNRKLMEVQKCILRVQNDEDDVSFNLLEKRRKKAKGLNKKAHYPKLRN